MVFEEWEHAADEWPPAGLDAPMHDDHSIVIFVIAAAAKQDISALPGSLYNITLAESCSDTTQHTTSVAFVCNSQEQMKVCMVTRLCQLNC